MPIRAVVVDDDDLSVRHLVRLLERWKGTIEVIGVAADGESALAMIARECPDVVFLDIDLPLLNGFEVCEQLPHRVPIVFVTASTAHRREAERIGALGYLCKPIGHDDLAPVISLLTSLAATWDSKNEA